MKFSVGEHWKTRNGRIVEIKQTNFGNSYYPIFGVYADTKNPVGGMTFTVDGNQLSGSAYSANDLVEKVNYDVPKPKEVVHPLQKIINEGISAIPLHEGGYGAHTVYLTHEMYEALRAAVARDTDTKNTTIPLLQLHELFEERDVYKALLDGMGFNVPKEEMGRPNSVYNAHQQGKDFLQRITELRDQLSAFIPN